jgi:hypothetical protein
MEFYGLLHVSEGARQSPNIAGRGSASSVEMYFEDAITLNNSLTLAGCRFTLLTNEVAALEALNRRFATRVPIRGIPFRSEIPSDVPFYSAHFKLDVFRWLASAQSYSMLADLDMVALHPPSRAFAACVAAGIPMAYDISDQVFPAFGESVVVDDLTRLAGGQLAVARWFGGEFIAGPPEFFAQLLRHIDDIWDGYRRIYPSLHHQGDEALTSAALCRLIESGTVVIDAGPIAGIGRFWSRHRLHPQKPLPWFEQCFLLHLPGDKAFVARQAHAPFQPARFRQAYRRHLRSIWPRLYARRLIQRLAPRHRLTGHARST